jgi:hypothetical protein
MLLAVAVDPGAIPTSRVKRTHRPTRQSKHVGYRVCLRLDFGFRCAYCYAHEGEVGPKRKFGGFQVEHFRPSSSHPALELTYDNLRWACPDCNNSKWKKWPSPREQKAGFRFVDVTREAASEHLEQVGDGVVHVTKAGEYTVEELELNSELHRYRRRSRAKTLTVVAFLEKLIEQRESEKLPVPIEAVTALDEARERIGLAEPWDAPAACSICA